MIWISLFLIISNYFSFNDGTRWHKLDGTARGTCCAFDSGLHQWRRKNWKRFKSSGVTAKNAWKAWKRGWFHEWLSKSAEAVYNGNMDEVEANTGVELSELAETVWMNESLKKLRIAFVLWRKGRTSRFWQHWSFGILMRSKLVSCSHCSRYTRTMRTMVSCVRETDWDLTSSKVTVLGKQLREKVRFCWRYCAIWPCKGRITKCAPVHTLEVSWQHIGINLTICVQLLPRYCVRFSIQEASDAKQAVWH